MGNEGQHHQQPGCIFHLPSEKIYVELKTANSSCGETSSKTTVKKEFPRGLDGFQLTQDSTDQIVGASCYIHKVKKITSSDEKYCYALYYLVGSIFPTEPQFSEHFAQFMQGMYEKFGSLKIGHICTDVYPGISENIFKNMKSVFDYTQDHSTIKKYVRGFSSPGLPCAEKYANYLDEVLSAYDYMYLKCRSGNAENSKSWCQEFNKIVATRSHDELLQLKCLLKHTDECPTLPGIMNNISYGMLTTASLLITFFFYKYILLQHHHLPTEEEQIIEKDINEDNNNNKDKEGRILVIKTCNILMLKWNVEH
ncbi:KIR-like protein [Plasmodium coatneyi]|uniref:KIR-like protein n=1 Tax=Plasmodium coatneyi TaxID=208452 RepID=A0A1B1DWD8_9APIC|nr:KIR-like protein [Plasmodium coatneyi]ANQ06949.1 KIR-like protein [Plasmodium coatneyi]